MESYIPISMINDYLFCPRSMYLHSIYQSYDAGTYHDVPQKRGKIAHEAVDEGRYSTSKHILQGTPVCSDRLGVMGRIDTFDVRSGVLVERKYRAKGVFLGQRYQLYAQTFCLEEISHPVYSLAIHSMSNNKRFPVPLPTRRDFDDLSRLVEKIRSEAADIAPIDNNAKKCDGCIYRPLCH